MSYVLPTVCGHVSYTVWYDTEYNLISWLTPYFNTCIVFELNCELIYITYMMLELLSLQSLQQMHGHLKCFQKIHTE